jgi:hypothetical protein
MRKILLLLLIASPAIADTLVDTRAALSRLGAQEPIRATYEIQKNVANEGKFDNKKFNGAAAVEIESDAAGLRVIFSRATLETAEKEQAARNRSAKELTPVLDTLRDVDPVGTSAVVDFAPVLLRMIEGAKVVDDRGPASGATWGGKPAHVLILTLADPKSDNEGSKVTYLENRLTLWLADTNLPMAAEHVRRTKISFLIFKGEEKAKRSWYFAQHGDRLVVTRHEAQDNAAIFGQKSNESRVETVKVH